MNLERLAGAAERAGLPFDDPADVTIVGADPVYATPYHLGEGAAAALSLVGQAANRLWVMGGRSEPVMARKSRGYTARINTCANEWVIKFTGDALTPAIERI